MPKPRPPLPEDCCDKGCANCVHDYYEDALKKWIKEIKTFEKKA